MSYGLDKKSCGCFYLVIISYESNILLCGHNLCKESGEDWEEPTSLQTLFSFSLQLNRFGEKWWILCYDSNKMGKAVLSSFLFSRCLPLFVSSLFCISLIFCPLVIIVFSNGNWNVYSMSPRFSNAYQWSGLFSKDRLEKLCMRAGILVSELFFTRLTVILRKGCNSCRLIKYFSL